MKIKTVRGSYKASEDYKSVEASYEADIREEDDADAAVSILISKAMNMVSSKLKGLKEKALKEKEDDI